MGQLGGRERQAVATESGERLRRRGWFWVVMVPVFAVASVPAYLAVLAVYFLATGQEFDAPVAAFFFGVLFVSGTPSFEEAPLFLRGGIAGASDG